MKRKGDGLPFIVHPMAVFGLLARWEASEDACIAGLLHDVLEDAPESDRARLRSEIFHTFGQSVLAIIEGVTEDESIPWNTRKELYMQHLLKAPKESLLVSAADQTHNVRSLLLVLDRDGASAWSRFTAPPHVKISYMTKICRLLEEHLPKQCTEELASCLTLIAQTLPPSPPLV